MNEAALLVVRKHIQQWPSLDALFVFLPEGGVQQVCVVLHEHIAHLRAAQQEGAEGFREHIAWPHGVPNLAAQLVFFVAGRGHAAEVAVGEVFDLVVVVKHHLPCG